jgi:hypothetical protein
MNSGEKARLISDECNSEFQGILNQIYAQARVSEEKPFIEVPTLTEKTTKALMRHGFQVAKTRNDSEGDKYRISWW